MVKPTIIVKAGKRYVKVGKKLVKISDSISERELIKWLVKHLKPKKRKRGTKEPKVKVATAPMLSTVITDTSRIAEREAKEKLEDTKKELERLKLSADIVAAVQQKSGIQQGQLGPGGGQKAITSGEQTPSPQELQFQPQPILPLP